MGSMGMDKWYWRMEEHKSKGHHIIRYPEPDVRRSMPTAEHDLFLKDERVAFWEKNHRIPTTDELQWWEREVEA